MNIPIENIYYLLCYAWNKLEEKGRVNVHARDYTSLPDLFAKILINATRILLKRGVDKNYQAFTEQVAGIKGKLEYSATAKQNLFSSLQAICTYDEFSLDILPNQLLVSTLRKLLKVEGLDATLRKELHQLSGMLEGIAVINIEKKLFRQVRLNRNNRFYGFILQVCELVHDNLLVTEEAGRYQFADFTRDEKKMNQLFEDFIRNFYRLEQRVYPLVGREHFPWKLLASDAASHAYLPQMRTDISLSSDQHKIIIEAKYYRETMVTQYEREKIRSGHLYQLFSYLVNQEGEDEQSRNTMGILLYPTTGDEYDLDYRYQEHKIRVRSVNSHQNWKEKAGRSIAIITKQS